MTNQNVSSSTLIEQEENQLIISFLKKRFHECTAFRNAPFTKENCRIFLGKYILPEMTEDAGFRDDIYCKEVFDFISDAAYGKH